MITTFNHRRAGPGAPGALLAMLVLVTRLMASLLPMPMDAQTAQRAETLAGLLSDQAICHADAPASRVPDHGPSRHPADHGHDCGLCPICHVLTASALPIVGAPDLRPRSCAIDARHALPPPTTGPPVVARSATSPRGPPSFSV
jgi:hypothetical protein